MKIFGTALLITISFTTYGQKAVNGYYSSKKADLGFFVTRIQLNMDSTFKYEFSGDLAYNKGTGKYKIEGRNLILLKFDSVKLDSTNAIINAISSTSDANRPTKLLYKRNRLYFFHTKTGKLIMNNYLIRRKGKELIFRGEQ